MRGRKQPGPGCHRGASSTPGTPVGVDGGRRHLAEQGLAEGGLVAPTLMMFEMANILRRVVARGEVGDDVASLAHAELLDLSVQYVDYEAVAERVWELRGSITVHGAAYVAVAEAVEAPLMTLDVRLARSPGPRSSFLTPPDLG